jgi:hypothetical protein
VNAFHVHAETAISASLAVVTFFALSPRAPFAAITLDGAQVLRSLLHTSASERRPVAYELLIQRSVNAHHGSSMVTSISSAVSAPTAVPKTYEPVQGGAIGEFSVRGMRRSAPSRLIRDSWKAMLSMVEKNREE